MARKPRKSKGNTIHSQHEILDGLAQIFKVPQSGEVWQFRMWIKDEQKHYRVSLRTRDLESALSKGRDLGFQLATNVNTGIKVFGITLQELVDEYLEYRNNDVQIGDITKGRWNTMRTQFKHLLDIKGRDTKLSELDRDCLFDYLQERKLRIPEVKTVTIRNEQATINAMMEFGYRKGHTPIDKFSFRKIRLRKDDVGVRDTFTMDEYDKLVRYMRTYVSKKECPNDIEREERLMIRDYVLISSNTCLRVGEARQLTWGDIKRIEHTFDENEKPTSLVHLTVRAETSKVRATRKITSRGGDYFERLKKRSNTEPTQLVFSTINSNVPLSGRKWQKHWFNMMTAIGIDDYKTRNLTWYSLRHFGITCRVMANANLIDISKLAGTSVTHIENTYLKYREEQARTSALKNFSINKDGTLSH